MAAKSIAHDVLSAVKITEVYRASGGPELRHGRGTAFWRGGDGLNVSLNDARGTWYDFATGDGGGVLDLVVTVRGGTRQDALRWLADFAGVPMDDTPQSAEERKRWAAERRELERDLPAARYWRRALLLVLEETLNHEKDKFFVPKAPIDFALLRSYTRIIERLQHAGNETLVAEYREWSAELQRECAALVRWAQEREAAEVRALTTYLEVGA